MAPKTPRGIINKELTEDGRESPRKFVEREIRIRKQTKTKIKRDKKAKKELLDTIRNS